MLLREFFTRWSSLRLVLALIALMAGIDDALEVVAGVRDIFHLDALHGVVSLSLFSLSKAIKETIDDIAKARKNSK